MWWSRNAQLYFPFAELLLLWLAVGALFRAGETPVAVTVAVLGVMHLAACLATVATGLAISGWASRANARRWALSALAVTAAALVAAAFLSPPVVDGDLRDGPRVLAIMAAGAFTCGALAVTAPLRRLWPLALATGALAGIDAHQSQGDVLVAAVLAAGIACLWAGSIKVEVSYSRLVADLEASRAAEARLAVAEERLRFSRDLHDVVGRALSAVAVKSELAAELARRGDAGAVDEMLAVHRLAHDSLSEARALVSGYRAPDLTTEFAGARALLASAGISARTIGAPEAIPPSLQDVFAWVVREAVTNVVRHANASLCTIDLGSDEADYRLRIVNDGVTPPSGSNSSPGSGLMGVRERLAAVGGTLSVAPGNGQFVLDARIPRPPQRPSTGPGAAAAGMTQAPMPSSSTGAA